MKAPCSHVLIISCRLPSFTTKGLGGSMTLIGYMLFIRAGQRWIVKKMHIMLWIKVPSFSLLWFMRHSIIRAQNNIQRSTLLILMHYLNIVVRKMFLFICLCASTIVKSLQQLKKKERKITEKRKKSNSNVWICIFCSCFSYFVISRNSNYLGKYFVSPPPDKSLPWELDKNWKEQANAHKQ